MGADHSGVGVGGHGEEGSQVSNRSVSRYVGQKFGMLTAIALVPHKGRSEMLCRCDCGTEKVICIRRLVPISRSCGCANQAEMIPQGTQIGLWTVLSYEKDIAANRFGFRCRCTCGTEALIEGKTLREGRSQSCKECGFVRRSRPDTQSNNVWHTYRLGALKRGLSFDLTKDQLKALILQECNYCGASPQSVQRSNTSYGKDLYHNGVDRIDSALGYTESNCVPCCGVCNYMKASLSVAEFYAWAARITEGVVPTNIHAVTEIQARGLVQGYKARAKRKGLDYNLTILEAQSMFQSSCAYCGDAPANLQSVSYYKGNKEATRFRYTGIDRIRSSEGYVPGNCHPACWTCNNAKSDHTEVEFLDHVRKIAAYQMHSISIK